MYRFLPMLLAVLAIGAEVQFGAHAYLLAGWDSFQQALWGEVADLPPLAVALLRFAAWAVVIAFGLSLLLMLVRLVVWCVREAREALD